MGIFINTNMNSLKSQRQLRSAERGLNTSFERLSSGVRVNGAKDDAAGSSIMNRMEAQTREMGRAVHNAHDAISLLQTSEGVLSEVTGLLQRMRELTVQAGNETNTPADRSSLQAEIDQLINELERAGKTSFNGRSLFGERYHFFLGKGDGGATELDLTTQPLEADRLGRHSLTLSEGAVNTHVPLAEGDLSIMTSEGVSVSIFGTSEDDDERSTANREGSAIAKAAVINRSTELHGVTARVGETRLKSSGIPATQELGAGDVLRINGVAISGFTVSEHDADGALQEAINAEFDSTGVIAERSAEGELILVAKDGRNIAIETSGSGGDLGFGNGVVQGASLRLSSHDYFTLKFASDEVNFDALGKIADLPPTPFTGLVVGPGPEIPIDDAGTYNLFASEYEPGDLDPDLDGKLYDGTLPGNVSVSGFYDSSVFGENRKMSLHFITGGKIALSVLDNSNKVLDQYYADEGAFAGDGTYTFLASGSVFGGGGGIAGSVFKITVANTLNADFGANIFGASAVSFRVSGGSLGDGLKGPDVPSEALIGEGFTEASLSNISVLTSSSAEEALEVIDYSLEELSATRAKLGAKVNRLESSVSNLSQTKVNLLSAKSRIQDADYALESVGLSRRLITQQASVSVLAQANTSPQVATRLLSESLR